MLEEADPCFLLDLNTNTNTNEKAVGEAEVLAKKEEHQDYVWRVYGAAMLLIGDYCGPLVEGVIVKQAEFN